MLGARARRRHGVQVCCAVVWHLVVCSGTRGHIHITQAHSTHSAQPTVTTQQQSVNRTSPAASFVDQCRNQLKRLATLKRLPVFTLMAAWPTQGDNTSVMGEDLLGGYSRLCVEDSAVISWLSVDSSKPVSAKSRLHAHTLSLSNTHTHTHRHTHTVAQEDTCTHGVVCRVCPIVHEGVCVYVYVLSHRVTVA